MQECQYNIIIIDCVDYCNLAFMFYYSEILRYQGSWHGWVMDTDSHSKYVRSCYTNTVRIE